MCPSLIVFHLKSCRIIPPQAAKIIKYKSENHPLNFTQLTDMHPVMRGHNKEPSDKGSRFWFTAVER